MKREIDKDGRRLSPKDLKRIKKSLERQALAARIKLGLEQSTDSSKRSESP